MRVQQAKAICPQLRLVHVQTIGAPALQLLPPRLRAGSRPPPSPRSSTHTHASPAAGGDEAADGMEVQAAAQSRGSAKACLQRYRQVGCALGAREACSGVAVC
jgi:hypothetical protein